MDARFGRNDVFYEKSVKALKNSTPQQERDACSLSIQQKLLSTGIFEQAGTILLYHALPDEVNTASSGKKKDSPYGLPSDNNQFLKCF